MTFSFVRRLAASSALVALGTLAACGDDKAPTGLTPLAVPGAPSVTSTLAPSATVTWTAVSGATSYLVQRAPGATGGTFVAVGDPTSSTSITDNTVAVSTTYRYRVAAQRGTELTAYSGEGSVTIGTPGPKARRVTGNITASQTWTADTAYTLSGFIKVQSGATLTIQPGTTIVGDTTVAGSSLWILRGARISAEGTAAAPIVFTSARSAGNRKPGDWGGIIIVGNGIINRTGTSILTEGGTAGVAENYAGGTDNNDNSGSLRYVRIEFAGFDVSNGGGQKLNTLSMYAVGRGTKLEYVQSMTGLDDSFEWWGGAVDGRYLVSYESGDDHFDWTEGYVGRNQFMIALQTQRIVPATGAGTFGADPKGFEGDGCDPLTSGCVLGSTAATTHSIYSMPVFANFTMVGTGPLAGYPTDGNGSTLRRGTGGTFRNGVLARWRGIALNMRDVWTDSMRLRDSLSIRGLVLADNGFAFDTAATGNNNLATAGKFVNNNIRTPATTAAALFGSLNTASLDWRPAGGAASVLATGGETAPAPRVTNFFTNSWVNTTYIGAIDPAATTLWYSGWTRYVTN
ncbi:MAG: fibronectin type III domain-containing protein [Phycisphaerae bacterium]|nr:fibronectin type III domain-containing protein [Gemmatimonadaceae bacterium]